MGESEDSSNSDAPRPTRRSVLQATAAGVAGTALAGCSGIQEQTFESAAISLNDEAKSLGYAFEDANRSEVKREISAGGQTVEATIISHVAAYGRDGGSSEDPNNPFVDEVSVGLVTTPNASVLDQNANPAAEMSMQELLESDFGKRFLRALDLGTGGWSQGPVEVGSQQVTMLDGEADAKTFVGVTSGGDLALINAARREEGGDIVLAGDARSRTYEGSGDLSGAVETATQEEAAAMFAEEVAPNVVLQPPGTATATESGGVTTYDVVQNGLTAAEAERLQAVLVEEFDADPELFEFSGGALEYVDETNYKRVPSTEVPADEVGLEMPAEAEQRPDVFPAIDRAGIEEMPDPPNQDAVASDLMAALESAELSPQSLFEGEAAGDAGVTVSTGQPMIELFDAEGTKEFERPLDTVVDVKTTLRGNEIVGSGSKIHASFGTVDGERRLTEFRYAHPRLDAGEAVEMVGFDSMSDPYPGRGKPIPWLEGDPELSSRRVFYSPPLDRSTDNPVGEGSFQPERLVPQYRVGGTMPGNEEVPAINLRETIVPAVAGEMVPEATIDVEVEGGELVANAEIEGGQPPYRLEWVAGAMTSVPSTDDGEPANVTIPLNPREDIDQTTVTLEVVDANGVGTSTTTEVDVSVEADVAEPSVAHGAGAAGAAASTIGGVADFGMESPVTDSAGKGFVRQMKKTALEERFSYWKKMAWERDYRDPSGPTAWDEKYGDNADLQYYVGHGNPAGFSFKDSDHEDGFFHYTEGNRDWGDFDAEWIALESCRVLRPDLPSSHPQGACGRCDGKSVINRWGDNFDGLHVLLGFQTDMIYYPSNPVFAKRFAKRLRKGESLVKAWLLTIHNHQANTNAPDGFVGRGRIIAPYGPNGVTGKDDKIWGKGSVAPDIPENEIRGWWVIRGG